MSFKIGDRVVISSNIDKLRGGKIISTTPTGRINVEVDSWNNAPYGFVRQFNKNGVNGRGYFREEIRIATPEDEEKAKQKGVISKARHLMYTMYNSGVGFTYEQAVKFLEVFERWPD